MRSTLQPTAACSSSLPVAARLDCPTSCSCVETGKSVLQHTYEVACQTRVLRRQIRNRYRRSRTIAARGAGSLAREVVMTSRELSQRDRSCRRGSTGSLRSCRHHRSTCKAMSPKSIPCCSRPTSRVAASRTPRPPWRRLPRRFASARCSTIRQLCEGRFQPRRRSAMYFSRSPIPHVARVERRIVARSRTRACFTSTSAYTPIARELLLRLAKLPPGTLRANRKTRTTARSRIRRKDTRYRS